MGEAEYAQIEAAVGLIRGGSIERAVEMLGALLTSNGLSKPGYYEIEGRYLDDEFGEVFG